MAFYFKITKCTYEAFKQLRKTILIEFPHYLINDVFEDETAHIWLHTVPIERFNQILADLKLTFAEQIHIG